MNRVGIVKKKIVRAKNGAVFFAHERKAAVNAPRGLLTHGRRDSVWTAVASAPLLDY